MNIDLPTLFLRQAVQPPYFAFTRVWHRDGGVAATFTPEQPMEYETGPIAAAEAGRHLAILGACAAATTADDSSQFYLAAEANLRRTATWPGHSTQLEATAKVTQITRRGLTATAYVLAPEPIYSLVCTYQILPRRLFERLFDEYRQPPTPDPVDSPYRTSIPFHHLTPITNGVTATCGPLDPAACAGHFPDFPSWPVAIVMHSLGRLAGRALHRAVGRECSYSVLQADISAEHLAFAGTPLSVSATSDPAACAHPIYVFDCIATIGAKTVGRMRVVLEAHE